MSSTALADLLIEDAASLLTLAGPPGPRTGPAQSELGRIEGGALAAWRGRIVAVGTTAAVCAQVSLVPGARRVEATGRVVLPGLVDAHTHLLFAEPHADPAEAVRLTRAASFEQVLAATRRRLRQRLAGGTTTVEVASGLGQTVEDELKLLRVAKALLGGVARTFSGGSGAPPEHRSRPAGYVDLICDEMLPRVGDEYLAEFCAVCCGPGAFSVEEARRILETGRQYGLKPKLHAEAAASGYQAAELVELAADVRAASLDHLEGALAGPSGELVDEGLRRLARVGVVATLLPDAAPARPLDARRLVDLGVPVALGTDAGPQRPAASLLAAIGLASQQLGLTPAEAIVAATVNAACAVGRGGRAGRLTPGYHADVLILDAPDPGSLGHESLGAARVSEVYQNGERLLPAARELALPD